MTTEDLLSRKTLRKKYGLQPKVQYMKRVITALKLINIWPNENKTFWNILKYHFKVWLTIASSILFILTFLFRIKEEGGTMDGIAETIDFMTIFFSATFRYYFLYSRVDKHRQVIDLIHDNFIHYTLFPSERKISLNKYIKTANRLVIIFGCLTTFWALQMHSTPLITYFWKIAHSDWQNMNGNITYEQKQVEYPIIIKTYVPFDISKQPNHALFYIYQIFFFSLYATIYMVVDYFWCMAIVLTIGQLVLVKDSLNAIRQSILDDEPNEITLLDKAQIQEVEDQLNQCIKHHQFLRKFISIAEDLINPVILIDSLHAVISVAFILLDLTIAVSSKDWHKILYLLEFFMASIFHMLWFDWLGNELAEKEEQLAETIYDIAWYKCPSQKTKVLVTSVVSRNPRRLTGGKMFHVRLEFFASYFCFGYYTASGVLDNEENSLLSLPNMFPAIGILSGAVTNSFV